MSARECVVCAWRATCNLKFRYESSELHCREFSRDVTLGKVDREPGETENVPAADKRPSRAE
ncbi:MAG: hypothetical protein HY804_08705 [Nitrospinae bacterium]|nr:hypothetical protein [Nitrospinota bacterium]